MVGKMNKKSKLDMLNSMWNDIKGTIIFIIIFLALIGNIIVRYDTMDRLDLIVTSFAASVFMVLSIIFCISAFNKYAQLYKEMKKGEKEDD
ncbi:MAG: hypothetical protein J7L80_02995 [Thermoplasmata archaeon]|nr:hypothetical protein [Thermoplasmata archaeon]